MGEHTQVSLRERSGSSQHGVRERHRAAVETLDPYEKGVEGVAGPGMICILLPEGEKLQPEEPGIDHAHRPRVFLPASLSGGKTPLKVAEDLSLSFYKRGTVIGLMNEDSTWIRFLVMGPGTVLAAGLRAKELKS